MYTFSPRTTAPRTEFFIGENIFTSEHLEEGCKNSKRRIALFVDASLGKTAGEKLKTRLNAEMILVPGGEKCKTREMKQKLEDTLLEKKFGKDTLIIAMGGGAVTDLIGYLASTYMRGVPLILIPASLLCMVDAAIGGKNGVDTPLGKNLIGTFYHPSEVYIDLQLLETLPEKEWINGLGEILKYGLICDKDIWTLCEKNPLDWKNPENLKQLIRASITAKLHILEEDPVEMGMRRILNFGHTVGHGLEWMSKYQLAHGEAVAIGCMAESWLSAHLGHLPQKSLEKILSLFRQCGYRMKLPKGFSQAKFLEALQRDKKGLHGQPRYVMIERIGQTVPFDGSFCAPIEERDFEAMLRWMQEGV